MHVHVQAMARCHRIGQQKEVTVYRLVTRDTYEEHLFQTASRKYGAWVVRALAIREKLLEVEEHRVAVMEHRDGGWAQTQYFHHWR